MMYRTTIAADLDLIDLYMHGVEQFGVSQSERYFNGMFETFEHIASNPHIARLRTEFDPPMRLHPYRSHLIAYVVRDDDILVVRVLHGRQDWQKLFQ